MYQDPGNPFFDGRLGVIDAAVGKLQVQVKEQKQEIDRLTEMVQCLVVEKFCSADKAGLQCWVDAERETLEGGES